MGEDRAGAGEGPDAGADGKAYDENEQNGAKDGSATKSSAGAGAPEGDTAGGGEDDSSTERNGDDSHLHDDQKAPTLSS